MAESEKGKSLQRTCGQGKVREEGVVNFTICCPESKHEALVPELSSVDEALLALGFP